MQIQDIKRNSPHKKKRHIGRGGKRGTTSGRGTKGQKARSGHKIRPEFRDVIKRLPKKRGYKVSPVSPISAVVNISKLEKAFPTGGVITPIILVEKGLVDRKNAKMPIVKILATGNITKRFEISGCTISEVAKEKIEKAGGKVTDLTLKPKPGK